MRTLGIKKQSSGPSKYAKKTKFGYTAYEGRHLQINDLKQYYRKPIKQKNYAEFPTNEPLKPRPKVLEEIIASGGYKMRLAE